MAIGTLALCYNNIEVFRGVVKMRRGKILNYEHGIPFSLNWIHFEIMKLTTSAYGIYKEMAL